ncbi:MAG: hypothetical protein IPN42_04630 [Methylococcaceae bacterium]|nr:hypothetical protein [Methylococcaceae bacterium]
MKEITVIHKKEIESVKFEPCWGPPSCVKTVIVTFKPELQGQNRYRYSYTRAYLSSWQQEHYVDPEETRIGIGEWLTSGETYEYYQYKFALEAGEKSVTIGNEVPYEDLELILRAIDRGTYITSLFPENQEIVEVFLKKVPDLLEHLRTQDIESARTERKHGENVYRLNVNPPEGPYEIWEFVIRDGQCTLVGYGFYYI